MCGPHGHTTCSHIEERQSCNIQSSRVQDISLMSTQKATTIRMNSDMNIMLKDDREDIQVRESTCQTE